MDKKLEDKDKIEPAAPGKPAAPDFSQTTVGAYNPELTQQAWDKSQRPWRASPQGRLAIRAFSRGILGAAFFSAGGLVNARLLRAGEYNPSASWREQTNPLKFIAKLIDETAGKGIQTGVNMLGGNGERAVRFRPTRYHSSNHPGGGHSLGEEVVAVTFDFFCASVGDAWGRDIAGWVDPNIKKKWIKDGHISIPEAAKQALKSATRYVTYNGGEDWAVAIPYVYFIRAHRGILNNFSPGFRIGSDRMTNGADAKISSKGVITGSYHQEGIVDLQHRFVVYNMGTLMFRELWDYFGKKLRGEQTALYGDPESQKKVGVLGGIGHIAKWFVRDVIKGGIYMSFATPFFWITRTPQTKYRGTFVNVKRGVLGYEHNGEIHIVHADEHFRNPHYNENTALGFTRFDNTTHRYEPLRPAGFTPGETGLGLSRSTMYKQGRDLLDKKVLNPIGLANHRAAEFVADKPAKWMDENLGAAGRAAKNLMGVKDFAEFNRRFVYASASYTPYMYMKAETARLWDTPQMDVATERLIDGAASLKWGEFRAGASEMWKAFLHKPLADAKREAIVERREELDTSLTDSVNLDHREAQLQERRNRRNRNRGNNTSAADAPNWRERVVQGEKPEVGANEPTSHGEREKMREALKELQPPTNSIN